MRPGPWLTARPPPLCGCSRRSSAPGPAASERQIPDVGNRPVLGAQPFALEGAVGAVGAAFAAPARGLLALAYPRALQQVRRAA